MKFLLLLYGDEAAEAALSQGERRAIVDRHQEFSRMLLDRGALIGGEPLAPSAGAAIVREGGRVSDGPFAETKEQLGGYYLVECRDRDEAIELRPRGSGESGSGRRGAGAGGHGGRAGPGGNSGGPTYNARVSQAPSTSPVVPTRIHADRAAATLEIDWQDGHRTSYDFVPLRWLCPCAFCRGEAGLPGWLDSRPTLTPAQTQMVDIQLVGNYAVCPSWADGHHTGYYTFAVLRDRCPCAACTARRASSPSAAGQSGHLAHAPEAKEIP